MGRLKLRCGFAQGQAASLHGMGLRLAFKKASHSEYPSGASRSELRLTPVTPERQTWLVPDSTEAVVVGPTPPLPGAALLESTGPRALAILRRRSTLKRAPFTEHATSSMTGWSQAETSPTVLPAKSYSALPTCTVPGEILKPGTSTRFVSSWMNPF